MNISLYIAAVLLIAVTVFCCEIDRSLVPAYSNGKVGYIDNITGKYVINPAFSEASFFVDGVAIVTQEDGKMGIIDKDGNYLLKGYSVIIPAYKDGSYHPNYRDQADGIYSGTFQVTDLNGKTGAYNVGAGWVLKPGDYRRLHFIGSLSVIYDEINIIYEGKPVEIPAGCRVESAIEGNGGYIYIEGIKYRSSGLVKADGSLIIPAKYDSIENTGKSGYWLCTREYYRSGRYYYLNYLYNSKGETVKEFKSRDYPEILDNTVLYHTHNNLRFEIDLNTLQENQVETEPSECCNIIRLNGKYGVANIESDEPEDKSRGIPAVYDSIQPLYGGYYAAEKDGLWGIVDIKNTEKVPFIYNSIKTGTLGTFIVSSCDAKRTFKCLHGLIDENGKEIYPAVILNTMYFNRLNQAVVYDPQRGYGVINTNGEEVIPFGYESIYNIGEQSPFLYIAGKDGLWGILGTQGETVLPFSYGYVYNLKEEWYLIEDKNWSNTGIFNSLTGVIINPEYNNITPGSDVLVYYKYTNNEGKQEFGFISPEGKWIGSYNHIVQSVSEPTVYIVEKDGLYAMADAKGKLTINFRYKQLSEVDPFYFKAVDLNGVTVFIDREGKEYRPVTGN